MLGGLAAVLLSTSCVQDMVENPEVGMLVTAGHVDIMAAKVRVAEEQQCLRIFFDIPFPSAGINIL